MGKANKGVYPFCLLIMSESTKQFSFVVFGRVISGILQGLFFLPDTSKQKAYEDLRSQIMELNGIRIEAEITMHELALSYVYSKSYVDKIVVGVDSVEQLISNYSSQFILAGAQVLDKIDKIVVENKKFLNPSTWTK